MEERGDGIPGRWQVEILNTVAMEGFTNWRPLSEDLRKLRKLRKQACRCLGTEHSRLGEHPVQRPQGGIMLGMPQGH